MPTLDFAAAWAEQEDDPLVVIVDALDLDQSEELTLPGSMPAGLRLHMWALRESKGDTGTLTYGELSQAGRFLFGAAVFQRWLDARITEDQLTQVVMTVLAIYAAREAAHQAEDPAGKAQGASEAPPTSSPTSTPSKPTSNASTASTSPGTSGG